MTTYTHQTAPTRFVEVNGNPLRLSPFRQGGRSAAGRGLQQPEGARESLPFPPLPLRDPHLEVI